MPGRAIEVAAAAGAAGGRIIRERSPLSCGQRAQPPVSHDNSATPPPRCCETVPHRHDVYRSTHAAELACARASET